MPLECRRWYSNAFGVQAMILIVANLVELCKATTTFSKMFTSGLLFLMRRCNAHRIKCKDFGGYPVPSHFVTFSKSITVFTRKQVIWTLFSRTKMGISYTLPFIKCLESPIVPSFCVSETTPLDAVSSCSWDAKLKQHFSGVSFSLLSQLFLFRTIDMMIIISYSWAKLVSNCFDTEFCLKRHCLNTYLLKFWKDIHGNWR